jgi:hypothetical protein
MLATISSVIISAIQQQTGIARVHYACLKLIYKKVISTGNESLF